VIVLSGVLTVVALGLLVLAGLEQDYRYVYAAIAATLVGAGLIAVTTYQRRGELTLDGQDEPRAEDDGVLVGVRPTAGELDGPCGAVGAG
jgi:hypothetical protein